MKEIAPSFNCDVALFWLAFTRVAYIALGCPWLVVLKLLCTIVVPNCVWIIWLNYLCSPVLFNSMLFDEIVL